MLSLTPQCVPPAESSGQEISDDSIVSTIVAVSPHGFRAASHVEASARHDGTNYESQGAKGRMPSFPFLLPRSFHSLSARKPVSSSFALEGEPASEYKETLNPERWREPPDNFNLFQPIRRGGDLNRKH